MRRMNSASSLRALTGLPLPGARIRASIRLWRGSSARSGSVTSSTLSDATAQAVFIGGLRGSHGRREKQAGGVDDSPEQTIPRREAIAKRFLAWLHQAAQLFAKPLEYPAAGDAHRPRAHPQRCGGVLRPAA